MAQRKYCKNTVPGRQGRGKKYPARVRAEVVMAMISSNSICAVARKYGVPESTIRSWMAEEAGKSDGRLPRPGARRRGRSQPGRRWEPGPRWATCSSGWPRTSGPARSAQSCGQNWTRMPEPGTLRSAGCSRARRRTCRTRQKPALWCTASRAATTGSWRTMSGRSWNSSWSGTRRWP